MPEQGGQAGDSTYEVELFGETVEYAVGVSSDATEPRIDVDINGVRVVLPVDSDKDAERLMQENANWVLRKKEKYEEYEKEAPDRVFEEGEEFPYKGDSYELDVADIVASQVDGNYIRLPRSQVDNSDIQEVLQEFYRDRAREFFEVKVEEYSDELDVEYESVSIRNQRTRWGSCSAKKNLSFNWRLIMAPPEVAEYVVVHELAHLVEKNHTKKFWLTVKDLMPDYKDHANWLDENSTQLIFTVEDL